MAEKVIEGIKKEVPGCKVAFFEQDVVKESGWQEVIEK
jgi:hypothetical protein